MPKKEIVLLEEAVSLLRVIAKQSPVIKPVSSKDGRFVRNADGTVTDNLLHLIWYPTLPEKMNWQRAKEECEKIGCRLPTRKELESLVDITRYNPAIDKEIFPDTKTDDWYWTGDSVAGSPGNAWCVGFRSGCVNGWNKDYGSYVRPCRSSQ
ncbi:MAG: DUF1566 domain-containing protein [Candidatus Omnitrophica bacterium]|nr:DUF1566 domain-containing protein [Candidatus Omnitrophota bacterium]